MDINKILENILKQYPVYPEYEKTKKENKVYQIVYEILENIKGKCLAIATSPYDINEIILKNGIEWEYEVIENIEEVSSDVKRFEHVLFISYENHEQWTKELQMRYHLGYIKDLYKILSDNGLEFSQEYYERSNNKRDPYADINSLRNNLMFCEMSEKAILMQKLIYLYIEIRDFQNAFFIMGEYIKEKYINYIQVKKLEVALKQFFVKIKKEIAYKKQDSIIMCWIDSIQYDEMEEMPFLYSEREKTLCFRESYTVTPYTIPTYFSIFCQKRCIKDELHKYKHDIITCKNSSLMQLLYENNYVFSRHGIALNIFENENCGYGVKKNDSFEEDTKIRSYNEIKNYKELDCKEDICPMVLWKCLRDLLVQDKVFVLAHVVAETHTPYICGKYEGEYINDQFHPNVKQINAARDYVDEQLRFYTSIWEDKTSSIMMSDHGKVVCGKKGKWYRDLYHTMLMIKGPGIECGYCDEMFSYLKFYDLIKWMIYRKTEYWNNLFQDYIEIEDLDKYGINAITQIMNSSGNIGKNILLGYSGIRKKDSLYIKRNDGKEMYFRFPCIIDQRQLIEEDEIENFRKLLLQYPINLEDDFYTYTRVIYLAIEYHEKRVKKNQKKAEELLDKLFDSFSESAVIALRGGGIAANEILYHIKNKYSYSIKYIIDNNITDKIGLPNIHYLTEYEINKYPIDIIIITSYNFRDEMKIGLEKHSNKECRIIDLYQYFNEYNVELTEDYHGDCISCMDLNLAYKELVGYKE